MVVPNLWPLQAPQLVVVWANAAVAVPPLPAHLWVQLQLTGHLSSVLAAALHAQSWLHHCLQLAAAAPGNSVPQLCSQDPSQLPCVPGLEERPRAQLQPSRPRCCYVPLVELSWAVTA